MHWVINLLLTNTLTLIMGATMGKSGGNFLDALPSQGTLHVVMLGLDSAGKTTALYRLKFDQYLNTVPTIGFNCEKVCGTLGKAKGVQFLVWDVGGQEKLRPLWRSYTRCTDGILFVVDSVDIERMEEAKMELLRTAKCPDNQGVPVLILANKQDLPRACDPKELEKLLGLHELIYPTNNFAVLKLSESSGGNKVSCNSSSSSSSIYGRSSTPTLNYNKHIGYGVAVSSSSSVTKELSVQFPTLVSSVNQLSSTVQSEHISDSRSIAELNTAQDSQALSEDVSIKLSSVTTTPTEVPKHSLLTKKFTTTNVSNFKGWHIQPACAITGEGLQEGLEALYEMIIKRRKLSKPYKRKR